MTNAVPLKAAVRPAVITMFGTVMAAVIGAIATLATLYANKAEFLKFQAANEDMRTATRELNVAALRGGREKWDLEYAEGPDTDSLKAMKETLIKKIQSGCQVRISYSNSDTPDGMYFATPQVVYVSGKDAYAHFDTPAFDPSASNGDGRRLANIASVRTVISTANAEIAQADLFPYSSRQQNQAFGPIPGTRIIKWYTSCQL